MGKSRWQEPEAERDRRIARGAGIGKRLKFLRKRAGLTMADVAGEIGVTPQMISKYEEGHAVLPVWRVPDIAAAISANPGEIFVDVPAGASDARPEGCRICGSAALVVRP